MPPVARSVHCLMKHMNHRKLITLATMAALGLSFLTVGCAHTISRTEQTRVRSNGTVESKEQKVTESPDGTITRTETKRIDRP